MSEPERGSSPSIALVLAGGGARGAYELGVLSVLAPVLEDRGERFDIIVGTSVGALNAAYLAANAHRPLTAVAADGVAVWQAMAYLDVLGPLLSVREFGRLARYVGETFGVPGAFVPSILDPTPLDATVKRLIDFDQLESNIASGVLRTAAVVATSFTTSRSVIFLRGGPAPPANDHRAIDYVPVQLTDVHVRASAAIPALFPAVEVTEPAAWAGWYSDGGTRLNAPLTPVLALGADRVIVIGLNSSVTVRREASRRPDALDGVAQLAQVVLSDQLTDDVVTLASINEALLDAASPSPRHRTVPYMFVAPRNRFALGELAVKVYKRRYAGPRGFLRARDISLIGAFVNAGRGPIHGELFSYLFFAREFIEELIELGRRDAQRWLDTEHDDGPWQWRRLPAKVHAPELSSATR